VDTAQSVEASLDQLRRAVAGRKVEPICTAYLALRKAAAANAMDVSEVLLNADGVPSRSASHVIARAFSRLRCPMCQSGVMGCDECEGSGMIDAEKNCAACKGAGIRPCDYCQGTGWAPRGMIPSEISLSRVRKLQLTDVKKDVDRLAKIMSKALADKAERLSRKARRNLASMMIRLRARAGSLAEEDCLDNRKRKWLRATASVLDTRLTKFCG